MSATIEFENERVRVSRVRHDPHERHPRTTRADRLVVYLDDGAVIRKEDGQTLTIAHKRGDVVWRARSTHEIANTRGDAHEALIIEFK